MNRFLPTCFTLLFTFTCIGTATPSAQGADLPRGKYELRTFLNGIYFKCIRFNASTGETWRLEGDTFSKVGELGPVPAGEFEVNVIPGEKAWIAYRVNKTTGESWYMDKYEWHKIKEK